MTYVINEFHPYRLTIDYRILPIKGALPNKGAPHSLDEANSIINVQNTPSFLNNCPIFNPKPPLESSESQLSPPNARCDLANAPGALIRKSAQTEKPNPTHQNAMFLLYNPIKTATHS